MGNMVNPDWEVYSLPANGSFLCQLIDSPVNVFIENRAVKSLIIAVPHSHQRGQRVLLLPTHRAGRCTPGCEAPTGSSGPPCSSCSWSSCYTRRPGCPWGKGRTPPRLPAEGKGGVGGVNGGQRSAVHPDRWPDYQRWERNQVENTCEYMSRLFQVSVLQFESFSFSERFVL